MVKLSDIKRKNNVLKKDSPKKKVVHSNVFYDARPNNKSENAKKDYIKYVDIDNIKYYTIDEYPVGKISTMYKHLIYKNNLFKIIDGFAFNIHTKIITVSDLRDIRSIVGPVNVTIDGHTEVFIVSNGFKSRNLNVKKNNYESGDYIIKDNNFFRVISTENKDKLALVCDDIEHALTKKTKYIYISSLGLYFENTNSNLRQLDGNFYIVKLNDKKLPLWSNVLYNKKEYIVFDNKDNALLACKDNRTRSGYVYSDGEVFLKTNGSKININDIKGFEDFIFSDKISSVGKYIVKNNIHLYDSDFNDFDEIEIVNMYNKDIKISFDNNILESHDEIILDQVKTLISLIYFNNRFYIKDIECLN